MAFKKINTWRYDDMTMSTWDNLGNPLGLNVKVNWSTFADGLSSTIDSAKTKDFLRRRAKGEILMNSVQMTKIRRKVSPGVYTFIDVPGGYGSKTLTGDWVIAWQIGQANIIPTYFDNLVLDAQVATVNEAFSKIASSDTTLLVTVGESRETLKGLAAPLSRADNLLAKMVTRRSRLLRKGLLLVAANASVWLEYRLAWKPLLFDIQNILKAYGNNNEHHYMPVRLTARAKTKRSFSNSVNYAGNPNYVSSVDLVADVTRRWEVSAGVIYELKDENFLAGESRRFGTRWSDLPATLWELVPLSFVVDRFVDVGTWLTAIMPKPGVSILGSWSTTVIETNELHTVKSVKVNSSVTPGVFSVSSGGQWNRNTVTYARRISARPSTVPPFTFRDLALQQHLDHLSLIVTKLATFR